MSIGRSLGKKSPSVDDFKAAVSEIAGIDQGGENGAVVLMVFRANVLARLM